MANATRLTGIVAHTTSMWDSDHMRGLIVCLQSTARPYVAVLRHFNPDACNFLMRTRVDTLTLMPFALDRPNEAESFAAEVTNAAIVMTPIAGSLSDTRLRHAIEQATFGELDGAQCLRGEIIEPGAIGQLAVWNASSQCVRNESIDVGQWRGHRITINPKGVAYEP